MTMVAAVPQLPWTRASGGNLSRLRYGKAHARAKQYLWTHWDAERNESL